MKVLFVISSSDKGAWLSEITHPYYLLAERGVQVVFSSPAGGKVVWSPLSDPNADGSMEGDDLISKGFLSDAALTAQLDKTVKLSAVQLADFDGIHFAGGQGATYDLFPNADVQRALEHFWANNKVVGAICHGAIALANNPKRINGRHATAFSLQGDKELEQMMGPTFVLPNYPQKTLEEAGVLYSASKDTYAPHVVVDGRLVTGQNQQSASEYTLAMLRVINNGSSPVHTH